MVSEVISNAANSVEISSQVFRKQAERMSDTNPR
jgi:hypothetical protein